MVIQIHLIEQVNIHWTMMMCQAQTHLKGLGNTSPFSLRDKRKRYNVYKTSYSREARGLTAGFNENFLSTFNMTSESSSKCGRYVSFLYEVRTMEEWYLGNRCRGKLESVLGWESLSPAVPGKAWGTCPASCCSWAQLRLMVGGRLMAVVPLMPLWLLSSFFFLFSN